MRGLNVDATNPAGCPDPSLLKAHGFSAVRLVCQPPAGGAVEQYAKRCKDAGLFVLAVIAHESGGYLIANADLYQLGNEPDGAPPSSWVQTPDEYVAMWAMFRGTYPGLRFIAAGLASGDPGWWAKVAPQLDGCHGVAVHPYGKDLAAARRLLAGYRAVDPSMPVYVTEWNRPANEIPGYDWWLRQSTAGGFWFCWSDGMVPPYGLVTAQGAPKPELASFKPLGVQPPAQPTPPVPAAPPKPSIVQKLLTTFSYGYGDNPPRRGKPVRFVVNHVAEGNGSLYGWFSGQELSTHFWVSKTGVIEQYVPLEQAAYGQGIVTAGSDFPAEYPGDGPDYNRMAVSIEREGYHYEEPTAVQWAAIVALNRWLAHTLNIPVDSGHIVGHYRSDHISRARCPSTPTLSASAYMTKLVSAMSAA